MKMGNKECCKVALIAIVCFMYSFVASAQIERNILGFTLGSTTKSQVVASVKSNNISYSYGFRDSYSTKARDEDTKISLYNVQYKGYTWDICVLEFINDKLGYISMWSNTRSAWSRFKELTKSFGEKYYFYNAMYSDYRTYFNDGGMYLEVSYQPLSIKEDMISITFSDIKLFRQKKRNP